MTRRRLLWLALAVVLVVLVTAGLTLIALPRLVRHAAIGQLETITGRPVTIEAVDFNLLDGRLSVRGFRVADHDGERLADFEALEGRFRPAALLRAHVSFERLTLTGAHVRIVRISPDRFNISDLLERPAGRRGLVEVSIDQFVLAGGSITLEDRVLTPARTWRTDDLRLDARDVTTRRRAGTAVASTTVAGALVSLRAEQLQLAPLHLRASVNVRDLDLRLVGLYLPANAPVVLERGSLDAGFIVAVDPADGKRLDAEAVLGRVALRRPGGDGDVVTSPELRVLVRDLHQRDDGRVALRYASAGGDLTVLDSTTATPRRLTFSEVTATASGGLEQSLREQIQIALHANIPGGGDVDAGGTVGLTRRRADVRMRARGIELAAIGGYLPIQGRLDGIVQADVRVTATQEGRLALTVAGEATVERAALADGSRTLASATRVRATGLTYTWPSTVRVGELNVSRPSVTVERDRAGAIGLAALFTPAAPPAADTAPPARAAGTRLAIDVGIARLRIEDGRALVTDEASGTRVEARGVTVAAEELTWPGKGPAAVRASASVAGAELSAQGTVDLAQRGADVAVRLRGADLAALQPWLPIAGRVRGAADADVRVVASHDGTLRLAVTGDTTLQRVALLDGKQSLAAAARIEAGGLEYTWPATVRVARLTVTQPSATVARDAQGDVNLAALLRSAAGSKRAATESPAEGAASTPVSVDVAVARLRVDDGRALVTDAASGGRAEVTRLAVRARDVSWPARGDAPVRLSAALAGGEITARGTVDAGQRKGQLAVTVRGADLTALQPWLPIVGRVRGAADADVTVVAALDPFALSVRGRMGATKLAFLDADQPLITVARVDATGVDLQWPTRLAIDRLQVNTPWTRIERNPQGELSLRALFARRPDLRRAAATGTAAAGAGPLPGLQVSVGEATFDNGGLSIVDDAVEPAARFELQGSRLALRDLTWPARGAATVQIDTPMPGREGTLKARGTFSIEPTRLALEVDLDQVDLAPARPYLPIDARLSGRLSGRAKITGSFGDTIQLVVEGDATAERLALGDDLRRLATVRRLEAAGLRYQYPTTMRVQQLTLDRPWLLLERDAKGTFELASLFAARNPKSPAASGSPDGAAPPPRRPRVRMLVGTLTMQDGFVRFVDRSPEPDFVEELSGVALTAEGLGTRQSRNGKVTLQGKFASGSPLSVHGELGSLLVLLDERRFVDVTVEVKDYPVPRVNPYLRRQLGWLARQGRLTAAVHYRIAGYDLQATNEIVVAGLDVERPDDPGQQGPPLDTIVSLLKNRDGVIRLDVPVRGSLLAPDFDYGDAVWTAMRNLAIRLVALPFSFVGKLFYAADSTIQSVTVYPVTFEVARATPTAAGGEQLQRLAAFLKQAPAVRLRLRPVTTVSDVTALRRQALQSRLAGPGADPAARRQAAVALYAELFPRREPPASDEALLEELTREIPTPPRALRTLAADRVAATRDALLRAGVAPERLQPIESRAAVESEGTGRVEFEVADR